MKKPNLLTTNFPKAASDYLYLLERGYPQRSVLKLCGDRYQLSAVERSVLYRGISRSHEALKREQKLVQAVELNGKELHIDGYNILLTLGSYLNGNLVFTSNDSMLRDASEIHGKAFREALLDKSILLLFSWLESKNPDMLNFYFDAPVSNSGQLCFKINQLISHYGFAGHAQTYRSPDFHLRTVSDGILATSDTGIIDHSKVNIIDLPLHVLQHHYSKSFFSVKTLLEVNTDQQL